MHPILADRPELVAIRERRDELAAAEQRSRERVDAILGPYREQVAQWRRDSEAAVLAGQPPPPEPVEPSLGGDADAYHLFRRERERLADDERAAKAAAAVEVVEAVKRREAELMGQARKLVDKLAPVAAELSELGRAMSSALAEAEHAAYQRTGRRVIPPPSSLLPHRVEVDDVVAAAVDGASLLTPATVTDPAAVTAPDMTVTVGEDGRVSVTDPDTRRLGLQQHRPFGVPPEPPPLLHHRPGYI